MVCIQDNLIRSILLFQHKCSHLDILRREKRRNMLQKKVAQTLLVSIIVQNAEVHFKDATKRFINRGGMNESDTGPNWNTGGR